jgi:hypothetical protein
MELAIPGSQIYICIGLVVLLFLFSRIKLGLSIAFCFTFFWGFIENRDLFFVNLETSSPYVVLYFVSGIVLIGVTLLSFVTSE